MTLIKGNYTKAIVIVHGKCELIMTQYIKNNLRLKMEITSDKKGSKSIQITSLLNYLERQEFATFSGFINKFSDIEYDEEIDDFVNFKIFTIMDTDDCSPQQAKGYKNKKMFKGHWLYPYIIPIYNSPNLDEILKTCNVLPNHKIKDDEKVKVYNKIFPIDRNYIKTDAEQLRELVIKLSKDRNTNLEEFINYCLSC